MPKVSDLPDGGVAQAGDVLLIVRDGVTKKVPAAGYASYQTQWDASSGLPPHAAPEKGHYWIVSVDGTTDLDGETDWKVKDWAIYDGTNWGKVDNTEPTDYFAEDEFLDASAGAGSAGLPVVLAEDGRLDDTLMPTQIKWAKGADIASATTLVLGTDGNEFDVTGTTAITAIATVAIGTVSILHFDDALVLTHDAVNLILPGGVDITTAAGDIAMVYEYATGSSRCFSYTKADGTAVVATSGGGGGLYTPISTLVVSGDTIIQFDSDIDGTFNALHISIEVTPSGTPSGYSPKLYFSADNGSTWLGGIYGNSVRQLSNDVGVYGSAVENVGLLTATSSLAIPDRVTTHIIHLFCGDGTRDPSVIWEIIGWTSATRGTSEVFRAAINTASIINAVKVDYGLDLQSGHATLSKRNDA